MRRREVLAGLGAMAGAHWVRPSAAKTPESQLLSQHDLRLSGDPKLARRALLLVPKTLPPNTSVPLLVLLHGLGETGNELLGIHAWGEKYGLVKAYERLSSPPLEPIFPRLEYLRQETRERLNRSLARRPFAGVAVVCPVTPNPHRLQGARTLDRYAAWLESELLPAVYEAAPMVLRGPAALGLDGCSLGGYVGLEVFLRRPELFGSFGGVQSAVGAPQALRYADRIARAIHRVGPRAIHISSSSADPYRAANELLSKRLHRHGVPHVTSIQPGPHNQPWLREIGTLEMLLWHDRQLARVGPEPDRVNASVKEKAP